MEGRRDFIVVLIVISLATSELETFFIFVKSVGIFPSGNYLFILLPILILGYLAFLVDLVYI